MREGVTAHLSKTQVVPFSMSGELSVPRANWRRENARARRRIRSTQTQADTHVLARHPTSSSQDDAARLLNQIDLPLLDDKGMDKHDTCYKLANGLALSVSFGNAFTFERTTICFSCEMYPFINPL